MIDFHSHILPNIDDGSRSLNETIYMIEEAKKAGFTKIISTSHYIERYYEADEEQRTELINEVKENIQGIELYLGNEIYITNRMADLIAEKKASTINNSKYVLFELPMNNKPIDAKEIVFRLIEKGYVPIIAHPERYKYVKENIEYVRELADMGVLFQSNYGSAIGMYGKKAQKTQKKLLEEGLIQFFGSDVHTVEQVYPKMPKILKKLRKILTEEELQQLTTENAQKVLNNEDIEI